MTHPLHTYIARTQGETFKSLAERAGFSRMHIWRLVNGKGDVTTTFLRKVAEATGGAVTLSELLEAWEAAKAAEAQREAAKARARSKRGKKPAELARAS